MLGNVVKNIGFDNIMFVNVVEPIVSATLILKMLKTDGSSNLIVGNVVKTMVSATLLFETL